MQKNMWILHFSSFLNVFLVMKCEELCLAITAVRKKCIMALKRLIYIIPTGLK